MNRLLIFLYFLASPHLLIVCKENTINFESSDSEHLEKLHQEYLNNDATFNKELARIERLGYQSAAGYAVYLAIDYLSKITHTAQTFGFVGPLYAMFFAVNLWEAGKSALIMVTCIDETPKIENQISEINTRLLDEKYGYLRQKQN